MLKQRSMFKLQQITMATVATAVLFGAFQSVAQASDLASQDRGDAAGAPADQIIGYWQRGEGEAILEVRRHKDGYRGVIVASERHPETIGTEVLKSLQYDAEDGVWRGRVHRISNGKEYKIAIGIPDSGRFIMTARVLFISRSVQFSRQAAVPSSETRLAQR
jgi:uncharacterized protein (DUF2147 family)